MKRARAVPKVSVYSRHREDCRWAGNDRKISCDCPKTLVWFRNGKLHRTSAETCDGEIAEGKALELTNSFTAAATGKPQSKPTTGKLIDEAITLFIDSKRQDDLTERHLARLKFELEGFSRFALSKGLANIGDVATTHVLEFRNSLEGAQNTRAKRIVRLIGFFQFAVEMGWIVRNVAKVKAVRISPSDRQQPRALTDAQFTTLLAAIPKVNGRTTDSQRRKLGAMVLLMRWTGLAIRDAVLIERARFEQNGNGYFKLFLRRAKTGNPVFCTLKPEIVKEIFAGANPEGRYLFVDVIPDGWRERDNLLNSWGGLFIKLGEKADLKDEHGLPYRFTSHSLRHTFVFWCLNHGLPTEDVAALIGDSVEVVVAHYSEWISGRQERLNERMMGALNAEKA